MKKLTLIVLSLFCTSILSAQDDPIKYRASGYFGKNIADDNSKMRDDTLYGIRGTAMLTTFYGLNIGYERIDSIDIKDCAQTRDLQRFYMDILVDGQEQYNVVPYITVGGGYELLSDDIKDDQDQTYDVSQFFISAGLGFKYNFIPELSMMIEGKALWKVDTGDVDYNVVAGLVYNILATTCDKTYVTDRINEKPQERNVLHAGALNNYSNWNKFGAVHHAETTSRHEPKPMITTNSIPQYKTKKTNKPKKITQKIFSSNVGGYYVLMGAFKTQNSINKIVYKLQEINTPYLLRENKTKGYTYVMVGTFASREEAAKHLGKLKLIQRDAYIAKMK